MSERSFARITIGGRVRRSVVREIEEFAGFAEEVDLTPTARRPEGWAVLSFSDGRRALSFADVNARGGSFEDLERDLLHRGIPFDRYTDAGWDWGYERCWWRPGMVEPFVVETRSDRAVLLPLEEIANLRAASPDEDIGAALDALIAERTPPPLPTFEIEED